MVSVSKVNEWLQVPKSYPLNGPSEPSFTTPLVSNAPNTPERRPMPPIYSNIDHVPGKPAYLLPIILLEVTLQYSLIVFMRLMKQHFMEILLIQT